MSKRQGEAGTLTIGRTLTNLQIQNLVCPSPSTRLLSEATDTICGVGWCGTSKFYNSCSNSHEIKDRFLISVAIGGTQVLPNVGFVFVFRFEKTYLKLKDFNFLCKNMAPFLQEMCVYTGIQMGFKILREVDVIYWIHPWQLREGYLRLKKRIISRFFSDCFRLQNCTRLQGNCAGLLSHLFLKTLPNYGHGDIKTKAAHSLPSFHSTEHDPRADLDFQSDLKENWVLLRKNSFDFRL